MKNKAALLLITVFASALFAGCGKTAGEYLKDTKVEEFVTLGEYKGIEIPMTRNEVTDEDVQATLDSILMQYPMAVEVDETAADGHQVNIDFVGKRDGVEFEGGSGAGYDLVLGSGSFIEDLEKGIVGMNKGEVRDIPVTFPDPYSNPELAGQEAVFTVTMNSVSSFPETQELTDAYVEWLSEGEQKTVAEFEEVIRGDLAVQLQQIYDNNKINLVTEAVLANCEFKELPESLVSRIETAFTNNINAYATASGTDMNGYMVSQGIMTADQNAEDVIREQAENTVKNFLAFQAIANVEDLNISDSEVAESLEAEAAANGMTVEAFEEGLDKEGYKEYLMLDKVTAFLVENAVETEAEATDETADETAGDPAEEAAVETADQPADDAEEEPAE